MSLLLLLREHGLPLPGGAVLLSPGLNVAALLDGTSPLATHDHFKTMARVTSWCVGGHPVDDPLLSPLYANLDGLPPMLVQSATGDPVGDDMHRLVERAETYGVEVVAELYPADTHVFQLFWSFLPEAQQAMTRIGEFTAQVRGAGSRPADRTTS